MSDFCLVITTVPNREAAENLAENILNNRLAACVQMADIRSFFIWEGKLNKEGEVILYIKTTEACYHDLEAHILEHHSYDVPEIIMLPITGGLSGYLEWINVTTALTDSSKS